MVDESDKDEDGDEVMKSSRIERLRMRMRMKITVRMQIPPR